MRWLIAVVAFTVAGWMAFDGTRSLLVGDYVTPSSGPYAGQLGLWSKVVEAAGIDPRSTLMKSIFSFYGAAWLLIIGAFTARRSWARKAMMAAAAGSLWYLPFGTLAGVLQLILLAYFRGR